jgi:hypothetical protein
MALCTQLDVEQKLQWDITAEPDSTVTALIADAQALIEAEVGRTLESASRAETFDGGPVALFLKYFPVTAITSVSEDGDVLTSADYAFKENGRLIRTGTTGYQTYWRTYKPQSIDVVYTGGYVSPDHDAELEHLGSLCAEVVARAFRKGAANAAIPAGSAGAVQSVSIEGSDSVTYATGGGATESLAGGLTQFVFLTEDERRQLTRYKGLPLGFA